MPLTTGTRVGPYEIQSPIGSGGMGEVYGARDSCLWRDVAINAVMPLTASISSGRPARIRYVVLNWASELKQ